MIFFTGIYMNIINIFVEYGCTVLRLDNYSRQLIFKRDMLCYLLFILQCLFTSLCFKLFVIFT